MSRMSTYCCTVQGQDDVPGPEENREPWELESLP